MSKPRKDILINKIGLYALAQCTYYLYIECYSAFNMLYATICNGVVRQSHIAI